ncbi:MAG: YggS family pyridoxal phosphate-dependent enzyme [Ruminococcaceae bacterium]|nr:YggS family pyridoxal phosphate-dependent enzyme [Oscillospiraceae bacterium]
MTEKSFTNLSEERKSILRHNLKTVLDTVDGRATVMAATKTVPPEEINFAIAEGLTDLGENRVQEFNAKYEAIDRDKARLHFIGTLQPNKVKYLIGRVCLIHSLDSLKLATEISRRSEGKDLITEALCEVNIGEEAAKGGIPESDVRDFLCAVRDLPGLRVRGLMVIGPHCPNPEDYRPFFARTKSLQDRLAAEGFFGEEPLLSMGMSDNYALAVEYGATIVRPGTAIFGTRPYPVA